MKLATAGLLAAAVPGTALIGYPTTMYDPSCAFACRAAIEGAMLACTAMDHRGGGHSTQGGSTTSPGCRAADSPFLTTLAWCLSTTCPGDGVETWKMEKYWAEQTTGDAEVKPKWTYGEALVQVVGVPTARIPQDDMMNTTSLVPHDVWDANKRTLTAFELGEVAHSTYG